MKLTATAEFFKKSLVLLGGFVVVYYFSVLIVIPIGKSIYRALMVKDVPPNTVYGRLDPLEFSRTAITGTPVYKLNTETGGLPYGFPNAMIIYKFTPISFSYLSGKTAKSDAKYFGFVDSDLITSLEERVYKWRNIITGSVLEINTETKGMKMGTPSLATKSTLFPKGNLNQEVAISHATKMLTAVGRFDDSLYSSGNQNVYFGKFYGKRVIETEDPLEAQIARVDFYRSINNYKIYGPDPTKGLLHIWVGAIKKDRVNPASFPYMETSYWEFDTTSTATYPIVSVVQAWKDVQEGKGIIASVVPKGFNLFEPKPNPKVDEILINDIYLAYYETRTPQNYLQPIYVFDGNYISNNAAGGDITIYFPAILGEYINQPTQK